MHVRLADDSILHWAAAGAATISTFRRSCRPAEITGAEAVHPGYGFLSENAKFAEILTEHGIKFIGPSAENIRTMGDKIEAKRTAKALGIPVVPGSDGGVSNVDEGKRIAREIGYPVIIKATAGGGGRGMKVARNDAEMENALSTAQTEAKAAFGNEEVYIEKYLVLPRHIEIQVLGDGQGNAVHLGERDCSLQRRHQKIWEEAHSPALNSAQRDQIGARVAKAMADISYEGVGTIEFLYENGEFYFIEMNTRLQVEHPVTEMITGLDLVQEQIRVAAARSCSTRRVTSPFGPCHRMPRQCGKIKTCALPGRWMPCISRRLGVRVDSALYAGYVALLRQPH
jgi:acetyl-CoA carboxylase biotin carboxylase subunit